MTRVTAFLVLLTVLLCVVPSIRVAHLNYWALSTNAALRSNCISNQSSQQLACCGNDAWNERSVEILSKWKESPHPQNLIPGLLLCTELSQLEHQLSVIESIVSSGYSPTPIESYYLGESYLKLDKAAEAVSYWKRVPGLENLLALRGQYSLHRDGNAELALRDFELSEAIRLEVTSERFMMYMGLCQIYLSRQSWETAEKYCKTVVDVADTKPRLETAYNLLGRVYYDSGDYSSAEDKFLKAVEAQPVNADAQFWLGSVYEKLGYLDRAQYYYQEAVRRNSDHEAAIKSLDRLNALKMIDGKSSQP